MGQTAGYKSLCIFHFVEHINATVWAAYSTKQSYEAYCYIYRYYQIEPNPEEDNIWKTCININQINL